MLKINYLDGSTHESIEYKSATDFMANQRLEVPDLEDYYKIESVTLDGKPVDLEDKTIIGLYKKFDSQGV
ncbi:hypothetical protein FEZ41_10295 [Lentilactobacillus parafarraginis]|jgi:hypothetical protein|uniref:Uncharacterized protein n=3 Tax=Lentilactobacillus parafarraginis TaxID=390842 RepID=A0A0R1YHZ0_9LACO|nr:hypothetical protein [Lentilactobacillus parafarraginis]EHL99116.1 hypothetical protein HMPREF9103_01121 [Lentilactobacillus parafarraginis F0439]KRM41857.1 hypothetical protein FD47_GL002048 [Lentilactobacillus parafarraginis DSM 18390 = JCM 14109]TLQ17973.1 hypothetical protein FEZ41_10295 [Lentilactobacillus parafarraginis]